MEARAVQSSPAPTAAPTTASAPATPPDTSPIIPDSQFDARIPSLDPELNRGLEPLDAVTPPAAPATPGATPTVPAPVQTPFPPVPGPVEDLPIGDPELAQPLPPLDSFDAQPAQPAQTQTTTAAASGTEPPRVRYDVVVTGLDAAKLTGRFRSLSSLLDARGEAVNGAMIEARANSDVDLAVRLLRSEGFYDGAAQVAVTPPTTPEGRVRVEIIATPGPRYRFGRIRITNAEGEAQTLAREALQINSGTPIIAANVEAAEANVLLRLPQQGYPFTEMGLRDILLDPDTHLGDYALPVLPGPRAVFRNVTTEGERQVFDVDHINVLRRFQPGRVYDRRLVDDLREAMVTTRLFSTVSAEPVRTGEQDAEGNEYVDILVRQEMGRPRSLDASIGFATGEGLRLEGAWEHRNLISPEGALRLALVAGTNEQSASARLRFNNWHLRDQALLLQAETGRRDYVAFEGYTTRLFALVSRESTPIWQKRWTYAYGAEILATNEDQPGAPRTNESTVYYIGGLIAQVGHDRSNSLLDPTRGFRLSGRFNPEASLRGDTDFYLRLQADASAYYPIGDSFVVAGRVRLGAITGTALNNLAPSRRFYAGGGGSVRGFGFQQLGPRIDVPNPDFDPEDEDSSPTNSIPTGGRSLTEFAVEGRYRFGNYGIVAFVDGGNVSPSAYPNLDDLRFGFGIGGRLYTNFGPIRVDIATPIGRREGESLISLYISIGQAF